MKKIIIFLSVAVGLMFLALSCSDDNGQNAAQAGTPAIHNISPALGPAGTKITITGENFSSISDNLVKIGGVTATVTSASDTELVVMVPPGVTSGTLDVTLNGDSDIKGSFTATGKDLEGQLLLNHSELTLYPYPHYAKTLEVIYSDSGNHEEEEIFWESSSENVATVDQNGRVTPLALGTTTITATIGGGANGDVGACEVSVVDGPVTKLKLAETKLNLFTTDQAQIGIATLQADVQETGLPVWSSDNQDVATVDQQGLVTAIGEGTANITVTVDNASASCDVTVLPSVYLVGYQNNGNVNKAVLWKNGTLQTLSGGNNMSEAFSVFVNGIDVYVAGHEIVNNRLVPRLWVNGTPAQIFDETKTGSAFSVFIEGDNIYVAGYQFVNNTAVARVWINGIATDYSDGTFTANLRSIFVNSGVIYATGYEIINGVQRATSWENGTRTVLGADTSIGLSIFADDNNVYTVGQEQINFGVYPRLWTNGNGGNVGQNPGSANSVFVANNNIYIAGHTPQLGAVVWTNNIPSALPDDGNSSWANSVFIYGDDVYVAGLLNENGVDRPKLWKNGISINLDLNLNDGAVYGNSAIFVK